MDHKWKIIGIALLIVVVSGVSVMLVSGGAQADCATDADGNVTCDPANPPDGDVGGGPGDQSIVVEDVPSGDIGGDGEVPAGDTNMDTSSGDGGNDTITTENADVNGNVSGDFVEGNGGDDSIQIDDQTTVSGTVAGDWAEGDGGDDTVSVDGTVEQSVLGDAATGDGGDDSISVGGEVDGFVAGDYVGGDGGDDTITIEDDGHVGLQVLGDWAEESVPDGDPTGGGADSIVVNGTVDEYVAGDAVIKDGGSDTIIVNGSVGTDVRGDQTAVGDGVNDTITVSQTGTVGQTVYGDWAVLGDGGDDSITVDGIVSTSVVGDAVTGDGGDDTIEVNGAVLADVIGDFAGGDGGNDSIEVNGAVLGDVLGDDASGDGGDDTVTVSGTVEGDIYTDNGPGRGEPLDGGDDIVEIIEGATIAGIIDGGPGNDTLSFTFSDLAPDDAAFIQGVIDAANANPGVPGTLTYGDETYDWVNFESFLSAITQIVIDSGGTIDLNDIDTTPGNTTPNAPGSDGRLCNWPNAAVYSSEDGIYVYGINDKSEGFLVIFTTPDEIAQHSAVPGSNTMLSTSPDATYEIMLNDIGDYQVNVGPDGGGMERFVTFDKLVPGTVVCGQYSVYDPAGTITAERLAK